MLVRYLQVNDLCHTADPPSSYCKPRLLQYHRASVSDLTLALLKSPGICSTYGDFDGDLNTVPNKPLAAGRVMSIKQASTGTRNKGSSRHRGHDSANRILASQDSSPLANKGCSQGLAIAHSRYTACSAPVGTSHVLLDNRQISTPISSPRYAKPSVFATLSPLRLPDAAATRFGRICLCLTKLGHRVPAKSLLPTTAWIRCTR